MRGGRGRRGHRAAAIALVAAASISTAASAPARAAALPAVPGTAAAFPRTVYEPGTEAVLQARLATEPSRSVFLKTHGDADGWDDRTLGDHSIEAQRDLTRAAKVRAFEYALDRTVAGGAIVPFPSAAARAAAGDFARDVLLQLYDRSRLAVPAPLGGWDRDISTSEEIVNASETLDLLLGAGYDLGSGAGSDRAAIVTRLRAVTQELWENYTEPTSAGGITRLHQNNHRTKSGAAMAIAAIVLADDVPASTTRRWFDTGAGFVDDLQRHTLITGDGAYAEGAFYYAYTLQNLVPYLAAWEHQLGAGSWQTADGLTIPSLAHTPLFARTQRWMLDMTMPDGSMASFDDASPNRSGPFGALGSTLPSPLRSAAAWRWSHQPNQLETWGNVDLAVESIVADGGAGPAAPTWAPTQFYVEGGNAVLRSSWDADATEALVLGEHDTASEFGRDRTGAARFPQSHEHADPGSFVLHAFGERLAIDPGYLSFGDHGDVNQPDDHNVVLIDGKGPSDYLAASFAWGDHPGERPPAEGQSTIGDTLDGAAADAVTVATDYQGAAIARRFLFGDDRYLVVADSVDAPGADRVSWPLHANGGGTSGGTFASTPAGGTWTIDGGRLSSGIASTAGDPVLTTATAVHEGDDDTRRTHTALTATVPASADVRSVQVLYPTSSGAAAPSVTRATVDGAAVVTVAAPADDRTLTAVQPPAGQAATAGSVEGGRGLLVVDRRTDGTLRSSWADGATALSDGDRDLVAVDQPGSLGLRLGDGTADVVATGASPTATIGDVGFTPAGVDGACGLTTDGAGRTVLALNRERRATLRATAGNSAPGADPGPNQRVAPGTVVTLDGSASCDADGEALSYRWELVSAPAGSSWTLADPTSAHPRLTADRVGPYRVRLVATDTHGAQSLEQEAVVIAGPQCADGVDDDLDGRIDTDDPDCDGLGGPEPPVTTSTTVEPVRTTTTTTAPVTPTSPTEAPGAEPIPGDPRYTG